MRSERLRWCRVGFVGALLLVASSLLHAQDTGTLDREVDPVVISGSVFAPDLTNAPIVELFLYAYRAATDTWVQIPWQIDEIDTSNFFASKDGLFDNDDQLVFMAKDAGDRAPETNWLDNTEARSNSRFELEVADPLDSAKKAWVYLYRSSTLSVSPGLADYMEYTPPETGGYNDIIRGITYTEGHRYDTGIINHYSVRGAVGGDDTDLVDRQKARLKATTTFGTINANEEASALEPQLLRILDGRVRLVREVRYNIKLPGTSFTLLEDVPVQIIFYPYHNGVGGKGIQIPQDLPLGAQLKLFRSSIDFDEHAKGMKLYDHFNSDVTIDEMADAINDSLIENQLNWVLITGTPGSIVLLLDVSDVGDSQLLYYDDSGSSNAEEADGTGKTGDGRSIGDTGLLLRANNLAGQTLNLGFTVIFLPPNQDPAVGPELADEFSNPLRTTTRIQSFTVPVELVSFTSMVKTNTVRLSWNTASETNNHGFEIGRRTGSADWQQVGFVRGSGTISTPKEYSFEESGLQPGVYDYRLKQIDTDGQFEILGEVQAEVETPSRFTLDQNYPNPFNPSTTIRYQVGKNNHAASTQIVVFDLLGREVRRLVDARTEPGYYEVTWDGRDALGQPLPSGVYFVRLRSGDITMVRKMLLTE